jgi:hypothetical protein
VVVLIIVIATASVVIGFAGGRWVIPPLLAGAWILYVAGREQEWWGSGVGDGWQIALIVGAVVAGVAGAAGVVARRRIKRAAPRSSRPDLPRRAFKGEP